MVWAPSGDGRGGEGARSQGRSAGACSRRNRLYPPRGRHVVAVSSLPSGGIVSTVGRPTRGSKRSAVSSLLYLERPMGCGWGNHPDTPHKHTPDAGDGDYHHGGREGCFLSQR